MSSEQPPRPTTAHVPSPIEATLRILLSTVPFLIGAAVVRQGTGTGVAAQLGQVPWLHDRRLTQLELSEDALPPNAPVLLDWPVPHQADWVGAPPRLLISRLVAFERTIGVLLATLVTREQLLPPAREAIELSCQLIASAVATEALMRESERQARRLHVLNELQRSLSTSLDARTLGRVLREAVAEVLEHLAFAVSLFHAQRDEVAYRYRVAEMDTLANELGRRPLDDGPSCHAARRGSRVIFAREVSIGETDLHGRRERRRVAVVQFPLMLGEAPIGIVTVQAFRPDGFSEDELDLAEAIIGTSTNYFAHARRLGLGPREPERPSLGQTNGHGAVPPGEAAVPPSAAEDAPAAVARAAASAAPVVAKSEPVTSSRAFASADPISAAAIVADLAASVEQAAVPTPEVAPAPVAAPEVAPVHEAPPLSQVVATPEVVAPDMATLDVVTPDVVPPQVVLPEVVTREVVTPDVGAIAAVRAPEDVPAPKVVATPEPEIAAAVVEPERIAPARPFPRHEPEELPRDVNRIARDLIDVCTAHGQPNALVMLADPRSGLLHGQRSSGGEFMRQLDDSIGLSRGAFVVSLDDPSNAIARACREARVVRVAWLYEILQPVRGWQDALPLERLAGGGRCTVIPLHSGADVAGALVVGPSADELDDATLDLISARTSAAGEELAKVWRAEIDFFATLRGLPEETTLRLSSLTDIRPAV